MLKLKQNTSIILAFTACMLLLVSLYMQSRGLEGGQDSWMHYLISRHALHYPELLLDQWNKPVFTWCTVFICQAGIQALVVFNIICTGLTGLFTAMALRSAHKQAWVLVPLTVFCPVLFGNAISGLTEPFNAFILSIVFWLWSNSNKKAAVAIASLLPFVRTEGFVICGALFVFLMVKKEYRLLPYLLLGSVLMNAVGFAITGKPLWIITENPYWKFETEGAFDPGSGSILHFVRQGRSLFGLASEMLLIVSIVLMAYSIFRKSSIPDIWTLAILVFLFYFGAHSTIYYLGILGSHGLGRVMAVIAPCVAIAVFFALIRLSELLKPVWLKQALFPLIVLPVVWSAYGENDYAKPYRFNTPTVKADKAHINFTKAGAWLIQNGYTGRTIIHQSPFFNAAFGLDPYNPQSSYYIWSIDQSNDWTEKGAIVVWDGFSAVREGNMKLEWLQNNPAYKEIHCIKGFEQPSGNPEMYDIRIFEKIQ